MTKKTLNYNLGGFYFEVISTPDKNNLIGLSEDLDKSDAQNINTKVSELVKYIGSIYNQEKYKTDPRNIKVLKAGKLELGVEKDEPKLTKVEINALERFGDYNKIDVRDLLLSERTVNCLRSNNLYTLGDVVETGDKKIAKFRNLGKRTKNELRHLVYRFNPKAYDKYIGEKK